MNKPKSIADLAKRKHLRAAGLMSGTSADGIDAAIIDIHGKNISVAGFGTVPYSPAVRTAILDLCNPAGSRLDNICHYNALLGELFAKALIRVCRKESIPLDSIDLIGSHGQTIYHNPAGRRQAGRLVRSTLQIGEPSVIAERTGILTVADFRPRDMACGGQGAPLVPFADYLLFSHRRQNRIIQNIGGIANATWLPAGGRPENTAAFDTGPGNMVIDGLVRIITGGRQNYDRNGSWAARGTVHQDLLSELLTHPYFNRYPPKTCGREQFGLDYCRMLVKKAARLRLNEADLLATATALTAFSIAQAYRRFLDKQPQQVILCGGGYRNRTLVKMLRWYLEDMELLTTNDFGIDADAKEAVCFALLGWAAVKGIPANIPSATGAHRAAVLGKIVPL
ncbi:MAG TPA: anhydro-N-acetylmuramic acid kinase [Anaerohalosphaeraceae bacterium]|nr:anhydro-N-acetylmuramic acid kinase [Anaerohalosphaeraceae bacterium]HOL31253.1 anhydro-N-acetylmuramic acid kinase [Anaerohalosphaeraceae bacterium]HOM75018.1 anhydro-N-acetylmuramic acid kinase [Anaerohalosphaeraceae bacterium]HPC63644.1 anhydro-N-acetylmuramic acid kinase [Anaerohalosphaeraceae bacterium]HPO68900.1 anhydro-N-acetylmuramic acid kinase [Anaerohalosphaeraceae bacterium]